MTPYPEITSNLDYDISILFDIHVFKSDLRISTAGKHKGIIKHKTRLKLEKRQYLPQY